MRTRRPDGTWDSAGSSADVWLALRTRPRLFVVLAVGLALLALLLLRGRSAEYESTATYIVQPQVDAENDVIRARANLSGATKISNTFAYIIESELVEARAAAGVEAPIEGPFELDAEVLQGTNVVRVTVRSSDADRTLLIADAIGDETTSYVSELDDIYDLEILDPPTAPRRPLAADLGPARIATAGGLGLVAAALVVWLIQTATVRSSDRGRRKCGTALDELCYTRLRFHEEVARADETGIPFHMAVMRLSRPAGAGNYTAPPRRAPMRKVVRKLQPTLQPYHHLGSIHTNGAATLTAILPDLSDSDATELAKEWERTTWAELGASRRGTAFIVRTCTYDNQELTGDDEAIRVIELL